MENTWCKITQRDWMIQDKFDTIWMGNGAPKDAALFILYSISQEMDFYLTPGAVRRFPELVTYYSGIPCPPPNLSVLALLVGDQSITEDSNLRL
jgi:hypothetical protein